MESIIETLSILNLPLSFNSKTSKSKQLVSNLVGVSVVRVSREVFVGVPNSVACNPILRRREQNDRDEPESNKRRSTP